ncbi:hypothetical protein G647_04298 [Cladophialophora carrionii CBS 160.54]|uniref:Ribonuclease T2-like n=1 Tax=Cladophialophora carrionii CBS 160.54 TaxID=1279043 RepID=V9DF33_9EURO|nr:uncharacterized protein G647_04298 [Cladophialophora carrionii CBS 160.54]ETI24928.1 hypothetical protein G647_04298 [Cladophialophora carrionii CBS 160.54]
MLPLSQLVSQIPLLSSLLNHQIPLESNLHSALSPSSSSSSSPPPPPPLLPNQHSCPNPPTLSCPTSPPESLNTCCINHPSGHFLQTQFWDTAPPIGPNTSWTIHGLWPDLCSGGFDAFCDSSRTHSDIPGVLSRALADSDSSMIAELLDFMRTYWLSYDGDDEHLWSHEWNKHGTCISTLEPDCYGPEAPSLGGGRPSPPHHHLDVLDYFIHTTSLFRTLDTYSILAEAGILPSATKRYTLGDLEDAVSSSRHAQPVTFRCNYKGELNEIWYHFSVRGSLRHSSTYANTAGSLPGGESAAAAASPFLNASTVHRHFVPAPPDGILSNCPRRGIKYLPKHPSSHSPTATHSTSQPPEPTAPPSEPFTGKGHLEMHVLDTPGEKGCLIRHGEWYTSGQCATFRSKRDVVDPGHAPLFSLSSSYSPCLVNPATSKFECTRQASVQGIFSSSADDEKVLAYRNSSVFWAERVPGRFDKVDVFADDGGGQRKVRMKIHWVPV